MIEGAAITFCHTGYCIIVMILISILITCGRATCRCHDDPDARHGPYHYGTRKARGKTVGLKLTEDELVLALITGRQAP